MKIKKPSELWAQYRALVYPAGISHHQEKECRSCFLAGMAGMIDVMLKISEAEEDAAAISLDEYMRFLKAEALSENPTGES